VRLFSRKPTKHGQTVANKRFAPVRLLAVPMHTLRDSLEIPNFRQIASGWCGLTRFKPICLRCTRDMMQQTSICCSGEMTKKKGLVPQKIKSSLK